MASTYNNIIMQKKIQITGFLLGCIAIIAFAIQAGRHHENCRDCKLAFGKSHTENAKFASTWK
jgi:hypothetical protein